MSSWGGREAGRPRAAGAITPGDIRVPVRHIRSDTAAAPGSPEAPFPRPVGQHGVQPSTTRRGDRGGWAAAPPRGDGDPGTAPQAGVVHLPGRDEESGLVEHEFDHVLVGTSDDDPHMDLREADAFDRVDPGALPARIRADETSFVPWLRRRWKRCRLCGTEGGTAAENLRFGCSAYTAGPQRRSAVLATNRSSNWRCSTCGSITPSPLQPSTRPSTVEREAVGADHGVPTGL